ncbi:MAG TPA: AfsR/SARP family transcriptional regulator [Candidatus Limnocylindrales bacterium]|nr:AfsR/SARP family transcriptional regulator [Candidatus Limnocylindrales bacterium]
MSEGMAIRVLGPLRVTVDGVPVALPAKQRRLLAILALQANRDVPFERLIEASWGADAEPGLVKTLQSHVFQLRRTLRGGGRDHDGVPRIVTDAGGYRLEADPAAIDAPRFLALVTQAHAPGTDARTSMRLLTEALALWHGSSVADVGDEPASLAEVRQLDALRVAAIEDVMRVRLDLGEHESLVPDLRRALVDAPYNERLWTALMIALARSGRRAEALLAYRDAAAALRRELDIEPGPQLQAVARSLEAGSFIDHDPAAPGRSPVAHALGSLGPEDRISAC